MKRSQRIWLATSYIVAVTCLLFGAWEFIQTHAIIEYDQYDGLMVFKTFSNDNSYLWWLLPAALWFLYAALWLPYYYSHINEQK